MPTPKKKVVTVKIPTPKKRDPLTKNIQQTDSSYVMQKALKINPNLKEVNFKEKDKSKKQKETEAQVRARRALERKIK